MEKSDYIVFVGRFQPFHSAHLKIVQNALENADKVIIAVGSSRSSIDSKNPWTYDERKDMILTTLKEYNGDGRVKVIPIRDYTYSDLTWITSLQNKVASIINMEATVKMIGHFKDNSSIYLTFFPQWPLLQEPNYGGINGTDIRKSYFNPLLKKNEYIDKIPTKVIKWLMDWKTLNPDRYQRIWNEMEFLEDYNKQWENTPYPVNFVTTDAVVIQSGHILMVKRKMNPGKGQYALPGGFLGTNETLMDGCIRELYEEARIGASKATMRKAFVKSVVFDHPKRSMRGRIITHAHLFKLNEGGPLPYVKGGDDAYEAEWMPLNDVDLNAEKIFSDHIHIIHHFINVGH